MSNVVFSNIVGSDVTTTNLTVTNLNSTTINSGDFSYRPTYQQGITVSSTSNLSSVNVSSGAVLFNATTGQIGVDTTFTSNVYGIPLHMIIACSGESSNVASDGSFVATINAPTNMVITDTRAFLGTRPPDASNNQVLQINIGITSIPTVIPTSIYQTPMSIGPGQYTSWFGSGSTNGIISNGTVSQGSFIRIIAPCTNNGFPLPPQGLKVIIYYRVTS